MAVSTARVIPEQSQVWPKLLPTQEKKISPIYDNPEISFICSQNSFVKYNPKGKARRPESGMEGLPAK